MTAGKVLALLVDAGPLPAVDIARQLGMPLERTYGLLVAAEARRQVRINISSADQSYRTWEAMQEADDA